MIKLLFSASTILDLGLAFTICSTCFALCDDTNQGPKDCPTPSGSGIHEPVKPFQNLERSDRFQCGSNSVFLALRLLGVDSDRARLEASKISGDEAKSLLELESALRPFSRVRSAQIKHTDLKMIHTPTILLIDLFRDSGSDRVGHYVVYTGKRVNNTFEVIDGTSGHIMYLREEWIAERFSGYALLSVPPPRLNPGYLAIAAGVVLGIVLPWNAMPSIRIRLRTLVVGGIVAAGVGPIEAIARQPEENAQVLEQEDRATDSRKDAGSWRNERDSGLFCLFVVLKQLGLRDDFYSFWNKQSKHEEGWSMTELMKVAQDQQVTLAPVKVSLEEILVRRIPAVVHIDRGVDDGYFIVPISKEGNRILFFDGRTAALGIISRDVLSKYSSGVALVPVSDGTATVYSLRNYAMLAASALVVIAALARKKCSRLICGGYAMAVSLLVVSLLVGVCQAEESARIPPEAENELRRVAKEYSKSTVEWTYSNVNVKDDLSLFGWNRYAPGYEGVNVTPDHSGKLVIDLPRIYLFTRERKRNGEDLHNTFILDGEVRYHLSESRVGEVISGSRNVYISSLSDRMQGEIGLERTLLGLAGFSCPNLSKVSENRESLISTVLRDRDDPKANVVSVNTVSGDGEELLEIKVSVPDQLVAAWIPSEAAELGKSIYSVELEKSDRAVFDSFKGREARITRTYLLSPKRSFAMMSRTDVDDMGMVLKRWTCLSHKKFGRPGVWLPERIEVSEYRWRLTRAKDPTMPVSEKVLTLTNFRLGDAPSDTFKIDLGGAGTIVTESHPNEEKSYVVPATVEELDSRLKLLRKGRSWLPYLVAFLLTLILVIGIRKWRSRPD